MFTGRRGQHFVVLTARNEQEHEDNLKVAHRENINKAELCRGRQVIPIQEIGAHRMVTMMLNPTVIGILDTISQSGSLQLRFEEVKVPGNFRPEGMTLEALKIPSKDWVDCDCNGLRRCEQIQQASTIVNQETVSWCLE